MTVTQDNPFAQSVKAITLVGRFLERPEQVSAFFGSQDNMIDLMVGTARFFRSVATSNDSKPLKSKVDAWKHDCAQAIYQFRDITVGVASANVATSALSFVPVVGVGFAVAGAAVAISTLHEINERTNRMNMQLKKGCELSGVFEGVPGLPEYIALTNAMSMLPCDPAYKGLCHGIFVIVLIAAKQDDHVKITRTFVEDLIDSSDAALRDIQRPEIANKLTFAELHLALKNAVVVNTAVAGGLRLLGMMGPRGFSKAMNMAINMGALETAHQVAGKFGSEILHTTKVLRGMGKVFGGVAFRLAAYEVYNAIQAKDAAWEAYETIVGELDNIARDLTHGVEELLCGDE